mmetsp:Transcript_17674/g.56537  ORF Transcript_17674/g.56537 Transcript_17674/m.56537 type:complete len:531 (-) Transcript_17674:83-1675(-)
MHGGCAGPGVQVWRRVQVFARPRRVPHDVPTRSGRAVPHLLGQWVLPLRRHLPLRRRARRLQHSASAAYRLWRAKRGAGGADVAASQARVRLQWRRARAAPVGRDQRTPQAVRRTGGGRGCGGAGGGGADTGRGSGRACACSDGWRRRALPERQRGDARAAGSGLARQAVSRAADDGGQLAVPARVQGVRRRHHLQRDGHGDQPAAGPGVRVGAAAAARVRGRVRRADRRQQRRDDGARRAAHRGGDGGRLRRHQYGLPDRPRLQPRHGRRAGAARQQGAGHRARHVAAALVPSHCQAAHRIRHGQADRAPAHPAAARLGRRRGDAARPLAPAAVHQARRLGLHLAVRQRVPRAANWQRRRLQLRGRGQRAQVGDRHLVRDARAWRARQALALHRGQGAAPLGHLGLGAARHAARVRAVRPRALGHRHAWRGAHAQLPARVALLPPPLRARRPPRAPPLPHQRAAADLLRPQRPRDADGLVDGVGLGQDLGDAARAGAGRLPFHAEAQGQRGRLRRYHRRRMSWRAQRPE